MLTLLYSAGQISASIPSEIESPSIQGPCGCCRAILTLNHCQKGAMYKVVRKLSGIWIPEKSGCLVNILLGPLPSNESLQQVAYAKEDKPCVMGILVIAIAKLCILEFCTLRRQTELSGCGNDTDSYSNHLSAFRVLQVMCCLVAVSDDAHGQKRQQWLCCFQSHLLAVPTRVLWRVHY